MAAASDALLHTACDGKFVEYYGRFAQGDTTTPTDFATLSPLSTTQDHHVEEVMNKLMEALRSSPEHAQRVALLSKQDRTAGKYSSDKVLFRGVSSFEQMAALKDWLAIANIKKMHTFFFAVGEDDYIPVKVSKFSTETTLFHVFLGSSRGERKGPRYDNWALSEPYNDPSQRRFIAPLEALEGHRQPEHAAATVIKANAHDTDAYDCKERFGEEFACVESPHQRKLTNKKIASAGLNAAHLVAKYSDSSDPRAEEADFIPQIKYEVFGDEGYHDNLDTEVTPGQLIKSSKSAIVDHKTAEAEEIAEKLVFSRLQAPSSPALRKYVAEQLEKYKD